MDNRQPELGYQYLDTRFTGTSGYSIDPTNINSDVLEFLLPNDLGVAGAQSHFENKSFF